ncbi:adult cuticle protein 1-like [Eupeodes corollae]|uniref:adult cuticle protein 1-like n=1 Tax=Eupeodes corollae TaxID=290404 RepID=UPI002492DFFF|nr:adult cuticle protein 1-like [Eupeodes corollae]
MKFFICALVMCALSTTALSNVVPLALSSPLLYSAGPGYVIDNSQQIVFPAPSAPSGVYLYSSPLVLPSVRLSAEGTYIERTPGSEHIASLPGHYASASSINLQQAPGTNQDKTRDSSTLAPSVAIHGSAFPAVFPLTYSPFVIPAPIVVPSEATYVAKNLGIEHIAPLPGHSLSALSLNLEPAPGSK